LGKIKNKNNKKKPMKQTTVYTQKIKSNNIEGNEKQFLKKDNGLFFIC
jgi:hypothetical protein